LRYAYNLGEDCVPDISMAKPGAEYRNDRKPSNGFNLETLHVHPQIGKVLKRIEVKTRKR